MGAFLQNLQEQGLAMHALVSGTWLLTAALLQTTLFISAYSKNGIINFFKFWQGICAVRLLLILASRF